MTEDKGRIFVVYTVMAVVHMIYVTGFGKTDHIVTFTISRNTVLKH